MRDAAHARNADGVNLASLNELTEATPREAQELGTRRLVHERRLDCWIVRSGLVAQGEARLRNDHRAQRAFDARLNASSRCV